MSLSCIPVKYEISVNNDGIYEDNLSGITEAMITANMGITCRCNGNTKIYKKYERLKKHITTQKHTAFVKSLNTNKVNHYIKSVELEQELKEKKIIIIEKDQEIQKLIYQIIKQDKLLKKMKAEYTKKVSPEIDLINFD